MAESNQPLTWKLFGAFLLAVASVILALPFVVAGFLWSHSHGGFRVGQGLAEKLGEWVKKQ